MPALLGSIYLGLLTVVCAVPLGVGAALFLEEYKRTNWFFYVLQTNINNLAGIPSIVYGIFGAFIFVELIFKPLANIHTGIEARNTLSGGFTLGLLTLPVVIVSAQEAIRAVPQSLRHGALALGATHWQVIWHLVLPNALPGILTGTILALSRALGEAAPLVFFGAQLYKSNAPGLFTDFTALPMQVFSWASYPDRLWLDAAAMASLVLLCTVLALNAVAIFIRNRAVGSTRW
jgi:phosphate transport system permease protein